MTSIKVTTSFNKDMVKFTTEGEDLFQSKVDQIIKLQDKGIKESLKRLGYIHPDHATESSLVNTLDLKHLLDRSSSLDRTSVVETVKALVELNCIKLGPDQQEILDKLHDLGSNKTYLGILTKDLNKNFTKDSYVRLKIKGNESTDDIVTVYKCVSNENKEVDLDENLNTVRSTKVKRGYIVLVGYQ